MKTSILISRFSQIAVLVAFFLPFFPRGCDSHHAALIEKAQADSIARADSMRISDSLLKVRPNINIDSFFNAQNKDLVKADSSNNLNKVPQDSIASQADTVNNKGLSDNSTPTERLSKRSKILRILIGPDDRYTGIGFMIDMFSVYLIYFGVYTAFLLFILGLIFKFKDYKFAFNLVNIIAWFFLLFASPGLRMEKLNWNIWVDKLWGYWICLAIGILMIIYDSIILVRFRNTRK